MDKSRWSTIDLTGQTPLGGDLTFRTARPSSWRLFLWVFYTSDVFIVPATSLGPDFMAHEYSQRQREGKLCFFQVAGGGSRGLCLGLSSTRSSSFRVAWKSGFLTTAALWNFGKWTGDMWTLLVFESLSRCLAVGANFLSRCNPRQRFRRNSWTPLSLLGSSFPLSYSAENRFTGFRVSKVKKELGVAGKSRLK